jgi:phosphopantothenoylcysteine decarboxylase/phosphopantothenate--cysteine ligase
VADFRPETVAAGKLKKASGPPDLRLVPTVDILAQLSLRRTRQVLVGFAAETSDAPDGLEAEGRRKLETKGLDLLVVNEVGRDGTGFGSDTNHAAILAADGDDTAIQEWTKPALASAICDRIAKLVEGGR